MASEVRAPLWLWLLSWAFWLTVIGAAATILERKYEAHRAEGAADGHLKNLRIGLCHTFSRPPRLAWWQCRDRLSDSEFRNDRASRGLVD